MSNSFSCLIVEDDAAFASLVAKIVRELGGEPLVCANLAEATKASANRVFELLLLDNHLPDGKAYGFFERLSRRHPDAPAIMITGVPDLTEAITLTRNGLFDYLTKPISADALEACIQRALLRLKQDKTGRITELSLGESAAIRGYCNSFDKLPGILAQPCCLPGSRAWARTWQLGHCIG